MHWEAHYDDGTSTSETPDPWRTRQFHLHDPKLVMYIPKGAYFTFIIRHHLTPGTYEQYPIVGWQWPDEDHGVFLSYSQDGWIVKSHR